MSITATYWQIFGKFTDCRTSKSFMQTDQIMARTTQCHEWYHSSDQNAQTLYCKATRQYM